MQVLRKKKKQMLPNSRNKIFSFFLLLTLFLLPACDNRPKNVLSKKEMVEVLTEYHLLHGTLQVSNKYYTPESNLYFQNLLQKHGITQAEFDSSMVWYAKNPKKFERIYAEVQLRLNNLREDIAKGKYQSPDSVGPRMLTANLWNLHPSYRFISDSARTKLPFKIQQPYLMMQDIYELRFLQRIAPEDSCIEPYVVMRIHYANGKTDSIFQKTFNDSILRRYTLRLRARFPYKVDSITGLLLGCKQYKGTFNAQLDSIRLLRYFVPEWQDSLKQVVEKNAAFPQKIQTKRIRPKEN
jgi:hypothetical protein